MRPAATVLLIALAAGCGPKHVVGADPCTSRGTSIVVESRDHMLWLCDAGKATAHFAIALGKGGTGKTTQGDNRTPLGEYSLGAPRPSATFHVFVPVGYPTAEQARDGATGGDIGIHGPSRRARWLGRITLVKDWTRGCIAVARDGDIDAIAAWVRAKKVDRVVLE